MHNHQPYRIAIVGVGKIARDQHVPSISKSADFELAATVSSGDGLEGVENHSSIDALLAQRPDISVLALCMPPQARFAFAQTALEHGKHVLMEKPPGSTISEVETLAALASNRDCVLFATWHSRFAPAVEKARSWLENRQIKQVRIVWKEDVRRWHPGQEWIWEPGGLGVFDPGINALSILTEIMPYRIHLASATLDFPENREAPIAAELVFSGLQSADISAVFDWRHEGHQTWDIRVETTDGVLLLTEGGRVMSVDGEVIIDRPDTEYDGIYGRFSQLLAKRQSEVDLAPLKHVADAFMLGKRRIVETFLS
ncbi:MAG: Gfo/Idh/MocA family oxidoreductase [Rhizobiaceae bacterium]|nr:Gfo/Idh/MocA family oxidoreductase [Rhizobiaceae bacterium]